MKYTEEIIDRAVAAYTGLAIGDALGATVEFLTPREIKLRYGVHRNIVGGGWLKLPAGAVTDDTQMSLALGNAIIKSQKVDRAIIAEAFSEWMRSKPVDIGNTVRRGLMHYRNTGKAEVAENEFDAGNGACMRSLPIALAMLGATEKQVRLASRLQSHVTHNNILADRGTECVVVMLQAAILGHSGDVLENIVRDLVQAEPLYHFTGTRVENPGGYIVETLQAVFQSFFAHDSFEASLLDVVNRGGDADTSGAILGMLAGARYGMASIPLRWKKSLQQSVLYACDTQARALLRLAPVAVVEDTG